MKEIIITALDIIHYLSKSNFNDNFEVGVSEFCPYGESIRIDAFYFNRWNRETKGYEIKVNRLDFLADKKWQKYLKYCTFFYFIAPKDLIKPEELPDNIGLIEISVTERPLEKWESDYYDPGETRFTFVRKFKKKAKRLPDIKHEDYVKLLEGLLIKLSYEKNLLK